MRAWAVTGLLLVSACSRSNAPWVDRLEVDAFEGGEVISLSKEQLEKQLVEGLAAAKFKIARDGKQPPEGVKPWRVALAAGLSEPDLESKTSSLELVLELAHSGDSEPFVIDRRKRVPVVEGDVEAIQNGIRDALSATLDGAVKEAAVIITLEDASADVLKGKLEAGDDAVKRAAVRLLVRKHDKAALPALLARLETDELDVLRSVVGQLVELRAPEAVNPLIEAASQKGPTFEREVVFAIGAIGGEDAEAYLDLVSNGHDDPLIRASAEQSLRELRAKKKRSPGDPK